MDIRLRRKRLNIRTFLQRVQSKFMLKGGVVSTELTTEELRRMKEVRGFVPGELVLIPA